MQKGVDVRYHRFSKIGDLNQIHQKLLEDIKVKFSSSDFLDSLQHDIWILLDDAQNAYSKLLHPIWDYMLKDKVSQKENGFGFRFVIATTHDVSTENSPIAFRSYPHENAPPLDENEASQLFAHWSKDKPWEHWTEFRNQLLELGSGHIGIFLGGLKMLGRLNNATPKGTLLPQEQEAIHYLRNTHLFQELTRCFPPRETFENFINSELSDILQLIFERETNPPKFPYLGTSVPLSILKVSGILDETLNFSSPIASWYFYNVLFPFRAPNDQKPKSIDSLVIETVKSLSSLLLKQSCQNQNQFPKEAVFQHLFHEGLARNLPIQYSIIPEYAKNRTGVLDFFINGKLNWGIELLCLGSQSTNSEHIRRFQTGEKYEIINCTEYLVVNLTKQGEFIQQDNPNLCTFVFSNDFKECSYYKRCENVQSFKLEVGGRIHGIANFSSLMDFDS
jgi:hypothetical protein